MPEKGIGFLGFLSRETDTLYRSLLTIFDYRRSSHTMRTTAPLTSIFDLSEVSVGQHFYWEWEGYQLHGQVLLTSWLVFTIIAVLTFLGNSNLKVNAPEALQNVTEYITEFIRDLA